MKKDSYVDIRMKVCFLFITLQNTKYRYKIVEQTQFFCFCLFSVFEMTSLKQNNLDNIVSRSTDMVESLDFVSDESEDHLNNLPFFFSNFTSLLQGVVSSHTTKEISNHYL